MAEGLGAKARWLEFVESRSASLSKTFSRTHDEFQTDPLVGKRDSPNGSGRGVIR
jgi:hypothetical protein